MNLPITIGLFALACSRTAVPISAPALPIEDLSSMTTHTNPYELANAALEACRKGGSSFERLLVDPDDAGEACTAVQWSPSDQIQGLYFQRRSSRIIGAWVRREAEGQPAIWFRIVRVPGGFGLQGLVISATNPDLELSVEG